mmetsp:Transcript_7942/g.17042  ORF Transcript_7942/g.17042 Transcript_7942/m.17042 type:complete len:97 (-) Transcript_7942:202-492(-)
MVVIYHMYPNQPNSWVDFETGQEVEVWVEQEEYWHVENQEVVYVEVVNAATEQPAQPAQFVPVPEHAAVAPDQPLPEMAQPEWAPVSAPRTPSREE